MPKDKTKTHAALPVVLIGALLVGTGCIWFYLKKFVKTDTPATIEDPATKEA